MTRKLKTTMRGTVLEWRDAADAVLATFDTARVAPASREFVTLYGIRQYIADGGASAVSTAERLRMMNDRMRRLIDGTAQQRAVAMPHADLFRALVAVGLVSDAPAQREKFAALPAAAIAKLYARPDIAAWLEANAGGDADEAAAEFLAS